MAEGPYYSQLPTVAVKPFGSRRHCFCQCLIVTHVCILAKDISIVFFKIQLPRLLYVPLSKIRVPSRLPGNIPNVVEALVYKIIAMNF